MTYKEESFILDSIKQIKAEVHENNQMLKSIITVLNYWISRANQENEEDFARNIIANLISEFINIKKK